MRPTRNMIDLYKFIHVTPKLNVGNEKHEALYTYWLARRQFIYTRGMNLRTPF